MGEKAATNEVVNRLVILLGDTNYYVRWNACSALLKIAEKAATNEAINKVVVLLGDTDDRIRSFACSALGDMGQKAATNEVVNALLFLLVDANEDVRNKAYEALGRMGEKTASNEVIDRLLILLRDTNDVAAKCACTSLGKMGEKAATNEVVEALLDAYFSRRPAVSGAESTLRKILDFLPCISDLKDDTVRKLCDYTNVGNWCFRDSISPVKFATAFLETGILWWLPIIGWGFRKFGYAITVTESCIVVYGSEEPSVLPVSNRELRVKMQDYFGNWLTNDCQGMNEF